MKPIRRLKSKSLTQSIGGFSLFEGLIIIAVIAIFGLIAIPAMSARLADVEDSKARKNAQQLAAVYTAAQAAGHDFYDGRDDAALIAENVTKGAVILDGAFAGETFGVPMSDEELHDSLRFLQYHYSQKLLCYVEEGVKIGERFIP